MSADEEFEDLARRLAASADHRILRQVKPRDIFSDCADAETKLGIILDTETTGLDPKTDAIIEFAALAFTFDTEGRVCQVRGRMEALADPGRPIPPEVTRLTGITDAMVAGRSIDQGAVSQLVAPAAVVIAHHAAFDRRFVERMNQVFTTKAWACSHSEVPWSDVGIASSKLDYLAMRYGLFHDGHRGLADCEVLLEILASPFPGSADTTLKVLLDTARKPTWRLWALDSPFDMKDRLKARGYRWSDGTDGNPRAWYRDVTEEAIEEERHFLATEIYPGPCDPRCVRVTAFDRFSERV